jgi:transposase
MEKDDARKLSPAEQHERRRQVIRAYKRGRTRAQIAAEIGLSHPTVTRVIERYEAEGVTALAPRTRGRRHGEDRALTAEQEDAVRQLIGAKRPEQLKMDFALWSRAAVRLLIEREYGVQLHVRSVGKYLARWGFTPQKPIKRAYEQSPAAVQAWLDDTYPSIAERAKKARWMIIDGAFNHEKPIEFFEALAKDAGRKVFLILDNLSVHHCKPVKAWLQDHPDQMEVFYLPSYSPELNPEERLNADLKHVIGRKVPMRTKAKLRATRDESPGVSRGSHVATKV